MLSLRDICKSYTLAGETIPILRSISLEVPTGEFLAIMGPSGSGKSTLMNIIGLLDKPTTGTYFFDGKAVHDTSDATRTTIRGTSIGFVFQGYNLIKRMRAIDQVILPLTYQGIWHRDAYARAHSALDRVGLGSKIMNFPNELSGGQQQRVAIARSLVINPRLLLCDEPTGALDTQTSKEVMDLFCALHQEGSTIAVITHDPEVARYAKRTVFIRDGVLQEEER